MEGKNKKFYLGRAADIFKLKSSIPVFFITKKKKWDFFHMQKYWIGKEHFKKQGWKKTKAL